MKNLLCILSLLSSIPFIGFSQHQEKLDSVSFYKAVQDGLEKYLNKIPTGKEFDFGFSSRDEFNQALTAAHDVVAYGINGNDIYIHNPGNGSEIRDYNDLIQGTGKIWMRNNRMNTSASSCLQTLTISGTINNATSTYKALNSINANCFIEGSNVIFKSNGLVELGPGFNVQTGSSFSIQNGNVSCP